MKTDEEKLEELVDQKSFDQLTIEERGFALAQLGSEEAYQMMRQLDQRLRDRDRMPVIGVRHESIELLKRRLQNSRSETTGFWMLFRVKVPAYVAGLLAIAIGTMVFFLRTGDIKYQQMMVAGPVRVDTVRVIVKDTVYREKTVIRYVTSTVELPKETLTASSKSDAMGVSMKEKEELDKLVVRIN